MDDMWEHLWDIVSMNVLVRKVDENENIYMFMAGSVCKTYKLPYEVTETTYGFTEYQWKHLPDIIRRMWKEENK